MPNFEITLPDGKPYIITAPEGASEEEAIDYANRKYTC